MTERLLAFLGSHANDRGVVLVTEAALLRELGGNPTVVNEDLKRLDRAGLVEIAAPLPFLVLRLKKWPANGATLVKSAPSSYSYPRQLLHKRPTRESYRPTIQPQVSEDDLLHEILDTLGETDGQSFQKAVELYSPQVIRIALDRVRRARDIRKSRTALFRHLLPRIARAMRDDG